MRQAALPVEIADQADATRVRVAQNFSDMLKAERWSRRAAAEALGLTHRYVNSRASGMVDMSASDLALFADFLKVPVSRFFAEPTSGNVTSMEGRTRKGQRTSDYKFAVSGDDEAAIASVASLDDARRAAAERDAS